MAEIVQPDSIYSKVFFGIHQAFRDYEPLTSLVAVRNQIQIADSAFTGFEENLSSENTPELVVLLGAWSQAAYSTSDVGVSRTQNYAIVITGNQIDPRMVLGVKEAALDALLMKGPKLGVADYNNNKIVSWAANGSDSLSDQGLTGARTDRSKYRYQSVGTVTVNLLKAVPKVRP